MKLFFAIILTIISIAETQNVPVNWQVCGVYGADYDPAEDIEDSVHASPNEFPWQVQIEDIFGDYMCSAVILDSKWLLATASCVQNFP